MSGPADKLPATAIIWIAIAAILILAPIPVTQFGWLTVALALAAVGSTLAIWLSGAGAARAEQSHQEARAEKNKRNGNVSRLMDLLDEDELDDLEAWMDARRDRRLTDEELRGAGR